jgi:hypothetical protein
MGAPAVICPRCRIPVEADKIDIPNRCPDRDCPLNNKSAS